MGDRSSGSLFWFAAAVLVGVFLLRDKDLNRPAPGFSLPDTYGGSVTLESYRGRPALLIFWTTWCGICRKELPLVNRMSAEFQRRGVAVLAVHVGQTEDIAEYLRSNRIDLTTLVDGDGLVGQAYHVSGVPKLVLIGADGKIKRSAAGMTDQSTLEQWMDVAGAPN